MARNSSSTVAFFKSWRNSSTQPSIAQMTKPRSGQHPDYLVGLLEISATQTAGARMLVIETVTIAAAIYAALKKYIRVQGSACLKISINMEGPNE